MNWQQEALNSLTVELQYQDNEIARLKEVIRSTQFGDNEKTLLMDAVERADVGSRYMYRKMKISELEKWIKEKVIQEWRDNNPVSNSLDHNEKTKILGLTRSYPYSMEEIHDAYCSVKKELRCLDLLEGAIKLASAKNTRVMTEYRGAIMMRDRI